MPTRRRVSHPSRRSDWLAQLFKPPNHARDRLPPSTPWGGVIAARVFTQLGWGVSLCLVLLGVAAVAAAARR